MANKINLYDLDPEIAKGMENVFGGGGIQLPFPAVYLYVLSGSVREKPRSKEDSLVPYTGGWASNAESFEQAIGDMFGEIPQGYEKVVQVNNEGESFEIYATRFVAAAVVGMRKRWVEGRSHIQILSYLGQRNKEKNIFDPLFPAVLSAKGWGAKFLEDAFSTWKRDTAKLRTETANSLPATLFYATIGMFNDEPQIKMVGKPGAQSPITPVQLYVPAIIRETPGTPEGIEEAAKTLATFYVGSTVATIMFDLRQQAEEWLHAWDNADEESIPSTGGGNQAPATGKAKPPKETTKPDSQPW